MPVPPLSLVALMNGMDNQSTRKRAWDNSSSSEDEPAGVDREQARPGDIGEAQTIAPPAKQTRTRRHCGWSVSSSEAEDDAPTSDPFFDDLLDHVANLSIGDEELCQSVEDEELANLPVESMDQPVIIPKPAALPGTAWWADDLWRIMY